MFVPPVQKGKHHHIIVSCQYSDASRQQLLLNFLLQECDSRILQHQEQAAAAPLLHRGRMLGLAEGYSTESRELWTPDGRLAVHNSQVIAIIR